MHPESRAGFLLANRLLSLLVEEEVVPANVVVTMLRNLSRETAKSSRYTDGKVFEHFDNKAKEIMAQNPGVDFGQ